MWVKLVLLVLISITVICYGLLWYVKDLRSGEPYDFTEDFKHTFLTPHLKYSGYMHDGKPRRIAPAIAIIGGVSILVIGIIKLH